MSPARRARDCPELLAFEEVHRRLHLGTRLPVGRLEVPIAAIVGSVGRVQDFDGCFRPRNARLRKAIQERTANPEVRDLPIRLIQVDHAYFVEDGHKRLSLAIADGRHEVDADVDRYETTYHLAPGATMESIRVTAQERRFRDTTGLAVAVPDERFPLSDPDGYLELEESVKAHAFDLSRSVGRLLPAPEGARHWYDSVYLQVLALADASSASRLLESTTSADRFLLFRKGFDAAMDLDWRIPESFIPRGRANLAEGTPSPWKGVLPGRSGRGARRGAELLPSESDAHGNGAPDEPDVPSSSR